MKKILFFIFLLPFIVPVSAQQPTLLSLKEYGGNSEVITNVSAQLDGGFIISITANGSSASIDSFCTIGGNRIIFMKYNVDASVLEWSKCYDSSFGYMFVTPGSDYVLGGYEDAYTHEFSIHKENAAGMVLWSKTYGDSAEAIMRCMTPTNDGGYIMFGETNYTNIDFPVHYGSWMNSDFAIIKVDSNGNKVWSRVIGGTGNQMAGAVIAGPDGGCYVVGTTTSDDYDCTGNRGDSSGSTDAYVARLDSNGNIIWHKDLGGSGYDEGNYGWPDGKGGIIVGATSGSHDGDVTHQVNYNGNNMWALDVDSSGNILWNNSYGGGGDEVTHSICKATDGSIWIAGYNEYRDSFEVDTVFGGYDAWFVHADSAGNFLSAKVLGSTGQDEGFMIYPLSNGTIIAGGYYQYGNGSFNASSSALNAFITVLLPWTTGIASLPQINGNLKIYPDPADNLVTVETKVAGNLVITDVTGRAIYKSTINNTVQIQLKDWCAGVYYVQVVGDDGYKEVQKLIVR